MKGFSSQKSTKQAEVGVAPSSSSAKVEVEVEAELGHTKRC